jgi:polysaccharide export outer membrane protein
MVSFKCVLGGAATLLCVLCLCSCITSHDIVYFKKRVDTTKFKVYEMPADLYNEPKIHCADVLTITIQTLDPLSNNIWAGNTTAVTNTAVPLNTNQYVVDNNGDIALPLAGKLHLANLNFTEAKALIYRNANRFYKDAIVSIHYSNFIFSVLGEVAAPRQYVSNSERINVLEAIAMAGDLTYSARRDNILVIREEDGIRKFARLNIGSNNIFKSPYFYLKQHDIIYVEPNRGKIVSSDILLNRNISLLSVGLTTAILFFSVISYLQK